MRKLAPARTYKPVKGDPVGKSLPHDSAVRHVTGSAIYVDDMPEFPDQLHVATGHSSEASARIVAIDLQAVRAAPGVIDVIVQSDIPGSPDIAPVYEGDYLLAGEHISHAGQTIFAVAATSFEAAQRSVALAKIDYESLPAVLDVRESLDQERFLMPPHQFGQGDCSAGLNSAEHSLASEINIKGQEHFYLEGQVSAAVLDGEGGVRVYSSSQHPSEIQKLVAEVLDLPIHRVQTEVRRMGGGFGGKESQAAIPACLAALFALRTGRPVRHRMARRDDMLQTGKRHPFWAKCKAGFDSSGKINAVEMDLAGDCGSSIDLSQGIVERAMFHADNAYRFENSKITGYFCKTNKVSATAFRGFGGPQGMLACESMMDDIARYLGKDPLDIRKQNLYQQGDKTPYGQEIGESVLPDLMQQLETSSDYWQRREQIRKFNARSEHIRKGLALTPVKFGISFTSTHLNQAGALVHIYTDGSIHLSHGGTEMGQGLFIKIAQIVARALGVSVQRVMPAATSTERVPNSSPTAASSGTDMNGMAALNACNRIKKELVKFGAEHFQCDPADMTFADDQVSYVEKSAGKQSMAFGAFIKLAYMNRVPLSSTGFYKTPKIWYDRATGQGRPFFYFSNGAACSEVSIDRRTGEYRVDRVDILHDVGESLNPAIDIGQIEGGFIQGMGWLTSEELCWDDSGKLLSNGPANYKIPTAFDTPPIFDTQLFTRGNNEHTIYSSKAVGEPPLMLPISVWCALRDACSSIANYKINPVLDAPATPEQVYWAAKQAAEYLDADRNEPSAAETRALAS